MSTLSADHHRDRHQLLHWPVPLLYIEQHMMPYFGSISLFLMSLSIGVPLLLIRSSASMLLPRAGPSMESVKQFFGVMFLGFDLDRRACSSAWRCCCGRVADLSVSLRAPGWHRRCQRLAQAASRHAPVAVAGAAYLIGALCGTKISSPLGNSGRAEHWRRLRYNFTGQGRRRTLMTHRPRYAERCDAQFLADLVFLQAGALYLFRSRT